MRRAVRVVRTGVSVCDDRCVFRCAGAVALLSCATALASCGGSSSSPPAPSSSTTHAVGGIVSGLAPNEGVTLLNNGADALVLTTNGAFRFSASQNSGSAYAVTVRSHTPGIACSVSNGNGSVGSSDVTSVGVSCAAGTAIIVYSFGSGPADGRHPQADLIMDAAGNLYGTTSAGGAIGVGTVFKISADGTETVLHSFTGGPTDGVNPLAGLVMDHAGNLYGTTNLGGANGLGTVFKIGTAGGETVLHSFAGGPTDGGYPRAGLIMDSAGALYGTTFGGGANGWGTVFKISANGTESVVHSFAGSPNDGRQPVAGLTMDSAGNLYGTTTAGGVGARDFGTVFKIRADGTESVLFSFSGADGGVPSAGLVIDSAGNLYGTTTFSGNASVLGSGVVFKISPAGTGTVLHFFVGGIAAGIIDGGYPRAGLILDSAGNLYGTTSSGGLNDKGTVFKITATGTLRFLHSFVGATTDGNAPYGGLILDTAGNLYGTTGVGGANDAGVVFKIN